MASDLRSLYLVPTGAKDLLDDEVCDGRVPGVRERADGTWCSAEGFAAEALALVHEGRVLPLAWWRAGSILIPADEADEERRDVLPRTRGGGLRLDPDVAAAVAVAERGEALDLWRVVREVEGG